jgi:uncharacterized protein YndB with AHSA1/START domain
MRTTYHGEIDAPIERVFDLVERPECRKQWLAGVQETTLLADGGSRSVGAPFRQRVSGGFGVAELAGEVTAYEHPHHLGLRIGDRSFVVQVDYWLTPVGLRTRLDYTAELVAGSALVRAAERAFGWLTKRILSRQMRRLKLLAESGQHA